MTSTLEFHERIEALFDEFPDMTAIEVYGVLEAVKMRLFKLTEGDYGD